METTVIIGVIWGQSEDFGRLEELWYQSNSKAES